MNSSMNGKMPALYVVVARTILPYLNASSTHSAMSSLAKSHKATLGVPFSFSLSTNNSAACFVCP